MGEHAMTPECDAVDCSRKSVHVTHKLQVMKFRGLVVRAKIHLCPDHFNEAMEHQAKRKKFLDELANLHRVENARNDS